MLFCIQDNGHLYDKINKYNFFTKQRATTCKLVSSKPFLNVIYITLFGSYNSNSNAPTAGTANTGGGGGGATGSSTNAAAGGKGVVILSMLTADYTGTTSGSPTVTTDGSNTILVFNSDGSYTA